MGRRGRGDSNKCLSDFQKNYSHLSHKQIFKYDIYDDFYFVSVYFDFDFYFIFFLFLQQTSLFESSIKGCWHMKSAISHYFFKLLCVFWVRTKKKAQFV